MSRRAPVSYPAMSLRLFSSALRANARGAKNRDIRQVLGSRGCDFIADERSTTDDWYSRFDNGDFNATAFGLGKSDTADSRQDVDAPWFPTQHPHEAGLCQLRSVRQHAPEAKFNQCRSKPSCVGQRWLDEYVEVFGEPRLGVDGQRVPSDQEVSGSRRGQHTQELVPVVVQVQSLGTTLGGVARPPRDVLPPWFLGGPRSRGYLLL